MIKKNLDVVSSKKLTNPKHPDYVRSFMLPDGTLVVAETYNDTEFDEFESVEATTVSDWIRTGQMPPTMGSLKPNSIITQAQFCEQFVTAFNAAGLRDAASAEAAAPVVSTPVTEIPKTE